MDTTGVACPWYSQNIIRGNEMIIINRKYIGRIQDNGRKK